jgi:hypothetical protein
MLEIPAQMIRYGVTKTTQSGCEVRGVRDHPTSLFKRFKSLEEPVGGDLPREPAGVGDPQRIGRYERAN